MKYYPTLAMLGACAAFLLPVPSAAQEGKPADGRDCLGVELIMFSGRPRPRFLLCEETEKRQALERISAADEEKPQDAPYPGLASDPRYQGLLLTLPRSGDALPARFILGKGFLKPGRGKAIRLDKGRKLEKFFLERSLKEADLSDSPTRGEAIGKLSASILADVEREAAQE